jgi:competence protein ComEA
MKVTIYRMSRLGWCAALVVTTLALALISTGGTSLAAAKKSLVNINTATQSELEAVKGVGPATAKKIIDNRPYKSMEDLSKAGLSPKKIGSLKSSLTVSETAVPTGSAATKEEEKGVKESKKKGQSEQTAKAKEQKAAEPTAGKPIDLNTADQKALEDLPGVGAATAKKIIEARPFKSVDDLSKIKGMSKAKVEALRDKVTVGPTKAAVSEPKPAPAASASKAAPAPEKSATVKEPVQPSGSRDTDIGKAANAKLAPGQKVNLNTASKEDLEKLPDIGPVKAQAIIDGRPYEKIEDITRVKGIKEGIFSRIKDNITVK